MSKFDAYYKLMMEACWKNYEQVGMKEKNGKMVPNCVPKGKKKKKK